MSKIQVNEIVDHFDTGAPDCPKGLTVTGFTTFTGGSSFSGDVSIGGTLTYEDVTNIDSVGIITARSGVHFGNVGSGVTINTVGAGTSLGFLVDGSERVRIDSSGRLLVGTSMSVATATGQGEVQFFGTQGVHIRRAVNSAAGPQIAFGKTRATTDAVGTAVQSGDTLGVIVFAGDDGTDLLSKGAEIRAEVDGTPGADDIPGRLVFSATADGASTPTERMRIQSDGIVVIGDPTTVPSTSTPPGSLVLGFNNASEGGRLRIINDTQINDEQLEGVVINSTASSGAQYRTAILGNYQSTNATINGRPAGFFRIDEYDGTNHNFWVASDGNFRTSTTISDVALQAGTIVGTQSSDIRLKSEVESCPYGLAEVNQINPIKFEYNKNPGVKEVGFSAQELQGIVPESVYDTYGDIDGSDETELAMKYTSLVPVLVNAVKELAAKNAALEARLTALEGGAS